MSLRNALNEGTVAIGLDADTKEEAIDGLLGILAAAGKLKDTEAARRAVLERERQMSTGMKNGIAIPHGKTDSVDSLVACVAVTRKPIDFDSLDGKGCTIFIMTLSPPGKTGPHLQFLAEVSQLFKSEDKRNAIANASSHRELLSILIS